MINIRQLCERAINLYNCLQQAPGLFGQETRNELAKMVPIISVECLRLMDEKELLSIETLRWAQTICEESMDPSGDIEDKICEIEQLGKTLEMSRYQK